MSTPPSTSETRVVNITQMAHRYIEIWDEQLQQHVAVHIEYRHHGGGSVGVDCWYMCRCAAFARSHREKSRRKCEHVRMALEACPISPIDEAAALMFLNRYHRSMSVAEVTSLVYTMKAARSQ